MNKPYIAKASKQRLLPPQERAFTLIELLFAFGLGVLCVGLGYSYFYSHQDAFKKKEIDHNFRILAEAVLEQIATDLQGIDFSLLASKMLLALEPKDWLGHYFVTHVLQDHPLFSTTPQTVRYLILEENSDTLGGLYRELRGQQSLVLPACAGLQVTFYVQDRTGKTFTVAAAKDYEGLAYAKICLSVKRPCIQGMREYCFERYVYYHYVLFL